MKLAFSPRFRESPNGFLTAHWEQESTPNPSQEGNSTGADERVLPSSEGSGVGRFVERNMVRANHFSDGMGAT